ncbi:primase C-terminal domain-containing protein, partial [Vibrio parahaemolyticus]|nr:primase C-terminal domain-containing protein [Vibrio parahaemolyticus]MCF9925065.1 primase C-terminal domain-containing protein [Vibrio parahaemolyticus]
VTVFHDHEYSLAELHDGCGDLDKRSYDNPVELADYERNVSLFRALRYHAYAVVHHFDSHKTFHAHLECKIDELNAQFSEPLSFNEIMCIAKSVSKWTCEIAARLELESEKCSLILANHLKLGSLWGRIIRMQNGRKVFYPKLKLHTKH